MALTPTDDKHKMQIEAGTVGRKRGHKFEATLSKAINIMPDKHFVPQPRTDDTQHLFTGNPAQKLLQYIADDTGKEILDAHASWLGGLATSGLGDAVLDENGKPITKSKSDVLIQLTTVAGTEIIGISVKTCSKKTPTNDQMYFTTARAFCTLLRSNEISVSMEAERGLSMFCGDEGFRPLEILSPKQLHDRITNQNRDPNRFYWEELTEQAKKDWKTIFTNYQDKITLLLFQKAYKDDPFPPTYLLHQTVRYNNFDNCEIALFSMKEIVMLSRKHNEFELSEYRIRKGRYKNDTSLHSAPRFGFIQFQRGGQKQHPTQLQFNLKAGYFRHI